LRRLIDANGEVGGSCDCFKDKQSYLEWIVWINGGVKIIILSVVVGLSIMGMIDTGAPAVKDEC
jgi:hypothetical protein